MAMDMQEASGLFMRLSVNARVAEQDMLERAAKMVETEAKRVIGTYDYGWPHLAPETIARKGADTPLLETGELRDSIEHYVDIDAREAFVGSNNPKATWHELGTAHIPPRPFLAGAAAAKENEIHEMVSRSYHAYLTGQFDEASELINQLTGYIMAGVRKI